MTALSPVAGQSAPPVAAAPPAGAGIVINDTLYFDFRKDISAQLLPLKELSDMAVAASPLVKYEHQVTISQGEAVRLAKSQKFTNASGFVNYSTGNQAILSTTPTGNDAIGQIANGYRAGVTLQLSLFELFGRKHEVRMAQSNQQAAVYRREAIEQQIRRELINLYQDLLTAQRILLVKMLDEENSLTALRIAEIEMQQRKLDPNTLANVSNRYSIVKSSTEEVKGQLLKSFYQLEALVGAPMQQLRRK
nr:TolC family protein [uncultured Arsenicibacter sp.]